MKIIKSLVLTLVAGGILSATAVQAEGNAEAGEALFKTHCQACHNVMAGATPDVYGVLLPLHGIVGKKAAQMKGFFYSKAMRESGVVWTPEYMVDYLENPKEMIPGIRMQFSGLEDEQERQDIVSYIQNEQQVDSE